MTKLFKRFVDEYKAILDMKRIYNYDDYRSKPIKNTILSVVILTTLLAGSGYLFNLLENIHFVFISLNTIIVCSFTIFKATKEIQFKIYKDITYNTSKAILVDVLYLLAIILTINSGLTLLLFMKVINVIFMIATIVIGIFINFIYFDITSDLTAVYKIKDTRTNIFIISLWIFLLYLVLFYIIDIEYISLAYALNTLIILVLLFFRSKLRTIQIINQEVVYGILILLTIILTIYTVKLSSTIDNEAIFLEEQLDFDEVVLDYDIDIAYYDDFLYYQEDSKLHILNHDLEEINIIESDISDIYRYFYDFDGNLKVIALSSDQSDIGWGSYIRFDIYDLSDIDNPILEDTFVSDLYDKTELILYEDQYILYEGLFYYSKYYNTDFDEITIGEDEILYEDEYKVIYIKGGYIRYIDSNDLTFLSNIRPTIYNNGKILLRVEDDDNAINIVDFSDYLNDNTDSGIIIEDIDWHYIQYFNYDGEYYYVSYDNYYSEGSPYYECYLRIYNDKGKLVSDIETDNLVFFTNNGVYTRVDEGIISINSDTISTFRIISTSRLFDTNALIVILTLLFFIPDVVSIYKRGGFYA